MFFQGQTLFWSNFRNGWSNWCETKRKNIGWILGIIWLWSWPLTSLRPLPWVFQGQIYLRNCWSYWCEMKRKRINRILSRLYDPALWPCPWPWPWSFKVRVWNSLKLGMGRLIWNEKDASHPFMTIILTSVTMVGWADVPDSDRGDIRHQCAVDISSCQERTETV